MKRKHILILTGLFITAAYLGREYRLEQTMPKAVPVAAPQVRSTFAENLKANEQQTITQSAEDKMDQAISKLTSSMPSVESIRQLGEQEIHHMPNSIAELSEDLGNIKQLIHDYQDDTHLIGKAIAFYRTCSTQTQWPSTVRALCLANLHEVAGESLDSAHVELYRLAKLAVELPES